MESKVFVMLIALCILVIFFVDNSWMKGVAAAGAGFLIYDRYIGWNSINNNDDVYELHRKSKRRKQPDGYDSDEDSDDEDNGGRNRGKNRSVVGGRSKREYEAKWLDINPDEFRQKVLEAGGSSYHGKKKYIRYIFDTPGGYVRVRREYDENDNPIVTLTSKTYDDEKYPIENEVQINGDFEDGKEFLESLSLNMRTYQENFRERFNFPDTTSVTIDWIPGFEPLVEVECESEDKLWEAAKKLGLKRRDAKFLNLAKMYQEEYGISEKVIGRDLRKLTFDTVYNALKDKITRKRNKFEEITKKYEDE